MDDDQFKTCPFCKEKIRASAMKCRYCGEWLQAPADAVAPGQPEAHIDTEATSIPLTEAPPQVTLPADHLRADLQEDLGRVTVALDRQNRQVLRHTNQEAQRL